MSREVGVLENAFFAIAKKEKSKYKTIKNWLNTFVYLLKSHKLYIRI